MASIPGEQTRTRIIQTLPDRIFYEISLSVDDAYMVTNNKKHFPGTPQVVTPTEMLMLLTNIGVI